MRLIIIGPAYPYRDGIAHYTTMLFEALSKKHDVTLINFKRQFPEFKFYGTSQFDKTDSAFTLEGERLIDSMNPLTWLRTVDRITNLDPDLVLIQWWHPFLAPALSFICGKLKREPVRVCYICHEIRTIGNKYFNDLCGRQWFNKGLCCADTYIAHSVQAVNELKSINPQAIIHYLPHPTYDVFRALGNPSAAEARRRLGITADKKVLLLFGTVRADKGLSLMLQAMSHVDPKLNTFLLVAGEFPKKRPHKNDYVREAERLGVLQHLHFIDQYIPNDEVSLYFSAANLVVLPYLKATQSGALTIAVSFNKPVLVTNVGSISDIIKNGETGFIVEPDDPDAIASAVNRYFSENLEDKMSQAINGNKDHFSWDRLVSLIETLASS